jgi:hypothetical protein
MLIQESDTAGNLVARYVRNVWKVLQGGMQVKRMYLLLFIPIAVGQPRSRKNPEGAQSQNKCAAAQAGSPANCKTCCGEFR